jgi:hypothetical protein
LFLRRRRTDLMRKAGRQERRNPVFVLSCIPHLTSVLPSLRAPTTKRSFPEDLHFQTLQFGNEGGEPE